MIDTSLFGDICNSISAVSVFAYTVAAFLYASPQSKVQFFDEEWIQYGFCVIQPDVPYWNSHDLCFYFDTLFVIVGLFIYKSCKGLKSPGDDMKAADELIFFNLLGHFGHGIAHAFIAAGFRKGGIDNEIQFSLMRRYRNGEENLNIMLFLLVGVGFWIGLLKGIMPKVSTRIVVFLAIPVAIGGLFVNSILGFAYVQAVLTVAFLSTQLTLPKEKKTFVYASFAASYVAVALVPWVESMACKSVASKLGGHLIFDVSIPVALITSYLASWHHYSQSIQKKEKST